MFRVIAEISPSLTVEEFTQIIEVKRNEIHKQISDAGEEPFDYLLTATIIGQHELEITAEKRDRN